MRTRTDNVRLGYGIFISLFTVNLGIIFIAQACGIFAAGGYEQGAYTRDIVGDRLLYSLLPFILWVLAVIGSFVIAKVLPAPEKRARLNTDAAALKRLSSRIPEGEGEEYEKSIKTVKRGHILRLSVAAALAVICIVCIIISATYIFNGDNFKGASNNAMMLEMFKFVGPLVLLALIAAIAAVVTTNLSVKHELATVKGLVAAGKGKPVRTDLNNPVEAFIMRTGEKTQAVLTKKTRFIIRVTVTSALAVLGITFVILGIFNDGVRDVLEKAIKICTECIGLG